MSVSDDVGNLFRRFGGDAGQYQEVTRDDDAKHAALRWPLLNALDIVHTQPVPNAGRAATPAASLAARTEPAATTSSEQTVQAAQVAATETTGPARPPLFARGHRHASMPPPVAPAAQIGASRFSAPPAVAPAADRANVAANAPSMSGAAAAPVAETPKPVTPASTAASAPSMLHASRETAPQRDAQPVPAAPFLASQQTLQQTLPRAPLTSPVAERPRAAPPVAAPQPGGSILSGLFGGNASGRPARAAAPSKDLSSLFARLSHGPAAPARSLRDSFRTRFKADGDA